MSEVRLTLSASGVQLSGPAACELSLPWLRSHCSCRECVSASGQRLVGRFGLNASLREASLSPDERWLVLAWQDGHVSQFSLREILQWSARRGRAVPFGMASRRALGLSRRRFSDAAGAGVAEWLELLADNQVLLLEGVPPEPEQVVRVARQIAPVLPTIYDESWFVTAEGGDTNIAYTALELPPHQDLSAYEAPPGVQLLHCLRFDADVRGGESTFVDALAAAEELQSSAPAEFQTLCEVWATFDKINARQAMTIRKPHVRLDDFGNIVELNWAPPFEGPYAGPGEREADYARAYAAFSAAVARAPRLELRLQPGELLMFLNRRTLHGRRAFAPGTGPAGGRVLQGCYLSLDDVANAWRRLERAAASTLVESRSDT